MGVSLLCTEPSATKKYKQQEKSLNSNLQEQRKGTRSSSACHNHHKRKRSCLKHRKVSDLTMIDGGTSDGGRYKLAASSRSRKCRITACLLWQALSWLSVHHHHSPASKQHNTLQAGTPRSRQRSLMAFRPSTKPGSFYLGNRNPKPRSRRRSLMALRPSTRPGSFRTSVCLQIRRHGGEFTEVIDC